MAIMKNKNWAAWPKLHAGGDDKLGIKFAWPKQCTWPFYIPGSLRNTSPRILTKGERYNGEDGQP